MAKQSNPGEIDTSLPCGTGAESPPARLWHCNQRPRLRTVVSKAGSASLLAGLAVSWHALTTRHTSGATCRFSEVDTHARGLSQGPRATARHKTPAETTEPAEGARDTTSKTRRCRWLPKGERSRQQGALSKDDSGRLIRGALCISS